ncbi:unnamed protein product, partial [Rotaria magnacalcarata]
NTVENEPINISNIPTTLATAPTITTIPSNVPLVPQSDPNAALIAALAATNAVSTFVIFLKHYRKENDEVYRYQI